MFLYLFGGYLILCFILSVGCVITYHVSTKHKLEEK